MQLLERWLKAFFELIAFFLEPDELFGHGTRITRCMLWEFIQGQSEKTIT